ncbi:MAG: hypothetical protein GYA56_07295 [Geobacteraceae bacterium]|nr:hypothetical protein [Geobacteraceae bacterium]
MMTAKNSTGESSTRECKIYRAGDVVFTLAGFYKDPFRGYDVRELVSGSIGTGVSVTESVDAVVNAVSTGLRDELARLRSEAPALYNKHIRGKTAPLVRILLAGREQGVAKVVLLDMHPVPMPSGEMLIRAHRTVCPGDCNSQGITAFFLTERTAIDAYLKKGGKLDWSAPERTAKEMVELVIASRAPGVGPPVDVLRLDAAGVKWVERKPECTE